MGKSTGFLDFERKENITILPAERLENFKEFHKALDEKARREQAGRCMNCGVPMCQSAIRLAGMVTGCPLHNYIPEWNDALYQGQFDMAAWRLLKTSSFPEFTGRVCPALCEKACNCGSPVCEDGPVTVHDNELYIIEKAFESGYMKPEIPAVRSGKKIAVVGAGPAGLAVADLLLNTKLTQKEILKETGYKDRHTISRINNHEIYQELLSKYPTPIRK